MDQAIITDMDVKAIKDDGYIVEKNKYPELSLVELNLMGIFNTLWNKYSGRDIAITQTQIGEILDVGKMTAWKYVKSVKQKKYVHVYYAGLPRRLFYENKSTRKIKWARLTIE